MINTSKLGTLVYLHTLDVHIMYYLKITENWNHIYINYPPAIEYTYLNLDVEATICQYPKYKHEDTYDTKCKLCDKNKIGDAFHYLFICPVFQEDRKRLLKEYYRKFPSMYKFIELMTTINMKDLRKLAEFATIIIRKFQ